MFSLRRSRTQSEPLRYSAKPLIKKVPSARATPPRSSFLCDLCVNPFYAKSRRASAQSLSICSIKASRLSNFASPRRKWWKATSIS